MCNLGNFISWANHLKADVRRCPRHITWVLGSSCLVVGRRTGGPPIKRSIVFSISSFYLIMQCELTSDFMRIDGKIYYRRRRR